MSYHQQPRSTNTTTTHHSVDYSPDSSGAATPTTTSASASSSTFLSSSFSGIVGGLGGLVRRFSSDVAGNGAHDFSRSPSSPPPTSRGTSSLSHSYNSISGSSSRNNGIDGVYTPPTHRTASPMRPPPLEPLELRGFRDDTTSSARLLTTTIAEEIRIMVPERQRIEDAWNLVYSLDQDGASLATLYKKCQAYEGRRVSFVLVIRDNDGGVGLGKQKKNPHESSSSLTNSRPQLFGAYLSDFPHPAAHYFGNGECFLWRASVLASLPPPPSADTTNLTTRSTTIASPTASTFPPFARPQSPPSESSPSTSTPSLLAPTTTTSSSRGGSGATSPAVPPSPSIRFKAFPYSGVNDFYIYCEAHWLSVGGGDGHYGLWLDDGLAKGVSSRCLTFGNEPLSDEGEKFGILGVEVWVVGRDRP